MLDKVRQAIGDLLAESGSHELMVDGTRLSFNRVVRLTIKFNDVFVASQISEEVILKTPLLVARQCAIEFQQHVVSVNGRPLACTNRFGQSLLN